jgi:hypothetical protein
MYNEIFRSPLIPATEFRDYSFIPHSWSAAALVPILLSGPYSWGTHFHQRFAETFVRDPRYPIALCCAVALLARAAIRPKDWTIVFFPVLFIATFICWEAQCSILRYLSSIELLVGILPMLLWKSFAPSGRRMTLAVPALALLFAGFESVTIYPHWVRSEHGSLPLAASLPVLPKQSVVVLLDESPAAYLAMFEPRSVRFVGANNNLVRPGEPGELSREAANIIRRQSGDLWGIETPQDYAAQADQTLSAYGLERAGCEWLATPFTDSGRIRFCALTRRRQ